MHPDKIVYRTLALLVVLGAVGQMSAKPNFTGEWKMDPARSSFAPLPAPDSLVRKVTQHDSSLKIQTTQFGQQRQIVTDLSYTTDGRECRNTIRGQEFTGTAQWQGDTLVVASKRQVQGMELTQTENWSLSADGHTLTIANHVQTPQGAFDITLVLERQ